MSDEQTRRSMLLALGVAAIGATSTEALADDQDEKNDYMEANGIRVYKPGKRPPMPKGLRADFEVVSPYGFKVVEVDGRPVWAVGSEQDYRESEAKRLGIQPSDVKVKTGKDLKVLPCYPISPTRCFETECEKPGFFCVSVFNSVNNYVYCACVQF